MLKFLKVFRKSFDESVLDHPDNFKSLYVPGFNRVFETETGFGFNYTISYIIPFFNK